MASVPAAPHTLRLPDLGWPGTLQRRWKPCSGSSTSIAGRSICARTPAKKGLLRSFRRESEEMRARKVWETLRPWVAEVARRAGLQGMRTLLDKKVGYLSVGSNADNATIAIDGDRGPRVQNFCCLTRSWRIQHEWGTILSLTPAHYRAFRPPGQTNWTATMPPSISGLSASPSRSANKTRMSNLSERNGDKSRFGRERKQKILRRKRNRELRKALGLVKPPSSAWLKSCGLSKPECFAEPAESNSVVCRVTWMIADCVSPQFHAH